MLVKKYGNRRLYDTDDSRYITLEELAAKVRGGAEVRVMDARDGKDLTQATLAQVVVESRGASRLLPLPVLVQLTRLDDDGFAEFLGRYVGAALELFLQVRQRAQPMPPYNPLAALGFGPDAFARTLDAGWPGTAPTPGAGSPAPQQAAASSEIAELRRELEELKQSLRRKPRR